MDPKLCTVVILHQIKPKIIEDESSINSYQKLLSSYYGQVCVQQDMIEAINKVKQYSLIQPTLLLFDLDAINNDTIIQLISLIVRDLKCLPNHVPLVVCSINDDTQIMLDCLHAGAVDYLLKPLYLNAIKTLFLKFHSYQQISIPVAVNSICNDLSERINKMNSKDTSIKNTLVNIYASTATIQFNSTKATSISKKRSSELKLKVGSWDFSPFGLSEEDLIHCVYLILDQVLKLPELNHISITQGQLYDFIIDLASVYHDENPYHNFAHAVDVLQCLFYMLCELSVLPFTNKPQQQHNNKPQNLLRPTDAFALLIAAIGHDAAHPGVNNMFLINSANPLATLYNDRSVLESLHSMTLFQLLNKHGIDKLVGEPSSNAYKEFRKIVVSSVLATDMALHHEYVSKIKEQAVRFDKNATAASNTIHEDEERILLCSALIKCADISNVARPFHWGTQWAELLVKEFTSQGDLEKELGMSVLPMNDRDKVVLEDTQIDFIRFVALDLFQNVRQVLVEISFAVEQMQSNLKQWESRKIANSRTTSSGEEDDTLDAVFNSSATHAGITRKRSCGDIDVHSVKKRMSTEKFHHEELIVKEFNSSTTNNNARNVANNPVFCKSSIRLNSQLYSSFSV